MKFVFIVQGEGRGHMTQAISLFEILQNKGHSVSDVFIGTSERRKIPDFVFRKITATIHQISSPNFVTDNHQKSIRLAKTIGHNLIKSREFFQSLKQIHRTVEKEQPDVILNFYDILGGVYNGILRPKCLFMTIGHQYLIYHKAFPFAKKATLQKILFKWNTAITAWGAYKMMALSFREYPLQDSPRLTVIPPVLRPEVRSIRPSEGDYYLAYMVNPGYGKEIIQFSKDNPEIKIEAFWDMKDVPDQYRPTKNLCFYQINDRLFLEKMAACKGLVTTAGFESICEALFLNKNVLMVPLTGQYEQACNALDAEKSGAGIIDTSFDFIRFEKYLLCKKNGSTAFQTWTAQLLPKLDFILQDLEENIHNSAAIPALSSSLKTHL